MNILISKSIIIRRVAKQINCI